ncbi:MAG: hypothetical protein ACP5HM_14520 [Anaerolineae bacterium]
MRLRHRVQRWRLSIAVLLMLTLGWASCTTPEPTTTPLPPDVLLSDDFSTNNGTWTLFNTPEGAAYIQQGELFLEDRGQSVGVYSQLVKGRWDNVVIGTRLRHVEGAQNNWMGVICRLQDEENYYLFAISADGYYLVLKTEDGLPTALVGPKPGDAVAPGLETNTLEAHCEGERLSLFVNGEQLTSVEDTGFERGAIALFADGIAGRQTTVAFDTLVIAKP